MLISACMATTSCMVTSTATKLGELEKSTGLTRSESTWTSKPTEDAVGLLIQGDEKKIFFTDWEGPWVTTDFALEISDRLLGNRKFFERLSQYDDYLFYVKKMPDYNAGDTLRLLAPFIAAHDITSRDLRKLANDVTEYVPNAAKAMSILQEKFEPVVISTSYAQFLETTAEKIEVKGRLFGTKFNVDEYTSLFSEGERMRAEKLIEDVSKMPEIRIDVPNRRVISGFETIGFLDKIFWKGEDDFTRKIKEVIQKIKVTGGKRKLEIVRKFAKTNPIAIGDSISDFDMLRWVKNNGVALSFNGNEYAIMQSNVAIVSNSAFSEAAVVEAFLVSGFEGVTKLINFYISSREKTIELIDERIFNGLVNSETKFYLLDVSQNLDDQDFQKILQESLKMRRILRGEAGKLG